MKNLVKECAKKILECNYVVITLGTSRVVRLKENGVILNTASNVDPKYWDSEMLPVDQNIEQLERIYKYLAHIRGGSVPKIFVTISPQRYLFSSELMSVKDDPFSDNMLSKSILKVATDIFCNAHSEQVTYFPSYEIVIDELRMVESISHYDFCHVEQNHTPKHVVKKFLQTYSSDNVLMQFELIEELWGLKETILSLLESGFGLEHKRILDPLTALLDKIEKINEQISPSMKVTMSELVLKIIDKNSQNLPQKWIEMERRIGMVVGDKLLQYLPEGEPLSIDERLETLAKVKGL